MKFSSQYARSQLLPIGRVDQTQHMALDRSSRILLKRFGLRIRQIRESKGWTLEQTEEKGYPSWQHLQRIESGKKNINLTTVRQLAKLFKISISELFKDL